MSDKNVITWAEEGKSQTAVWYSESNQAQPKWLEIVDDTTKADDAYRLASEGAGMVYRGDYQNAKQLLQALSRRINRKPKKQTKRAQTDDLGSTFHQHRAKQIHQANILNRILIVLENGTLNMRRAPELGEVVAHAIGGQLPATLMISLRALLGMIGAYEWHKKGVLIPALDAHVHADYGVYSPVRGEYLDLIAQAPLDNIKTAWDIGTGTGVIAALLAKRGVEQVIATDNNPRAIACANANIARLGYADNVNIVQCDLFPQDVAKPDLIVCNPPWIPAKANASIEHAIYDPNSRMLTAYLNGIAQYLAQDGEAWLVMSDFAEHLGLRKENDLQAWIAAAGLTVVDTLSTKPKHNKPQDTTDPLHSARAKEVTSLYRLKSAT